MKNLENVLSELEFLNSEVLAKLEKIDFKKLDERLEKINDLKINIDKEYFENLKKDIKEKRNELISMLQDEAKLFDDTASFLREEREFLINALQEIRIENDKLRKKFSSVFSKVQLFAAVIIFAIAAGAGYYFGCHFLK